jgi:ADP-ribose pyrophosphatase YjhB (NUDIX family)
MRYGISAGALILQDQRILLVRHYRQNAFDFWVPPGGGLKGEESIFDCAQRETFEETGLRVKPDRMVYVQEFVEPGYHFCKFFILCAVVSGSLTLDYKGSEEHHLVDARFWSQEQVKHATVYPEILQDRFWADMAAGFSEVRYLGLHRYNGA